MPLLFEQKGLNSVPVPFFSQLLPLLLALPPHAAAVRIVDFAVPSLTLFFVWGTPFLLRAPPRHW